MRCEIIVRSPLCAEAALFHYLLSSLFYAYVSTLPKSGAFSLQVYTLQNHWHEQERPAVKKLFIFKHTLSFTNTIMNINKIKSHKIAYKIIANSFARILDASHSQWSKSLILKVNYTFQKKYISSALRVYSLDTRNFGCCSVRRDVFLCTHTKFTAIHTIAWVATSINVKVV